jgi:ligand-binding sensor domain-containing protein
MRRWDGTFKVFIFFVLVFISTSSISQVREWVVYNMGGKFIRCLVEEGEYLWVGTWGAGLVRINKRTGEFVVYDKFNSGLTNNYVSSIAIDSLGNKWIGTNGGGLLKFDGRNWTVYTKPNFDNYNINVTDFVTIDKRGIIWLGTWIGLVKFDGVNWTVYRDSNSGLPNEWIHVIVIDEEGNKWIGTNGGLAKFDGLRWRVYKTSNSGLPSDTVRSIAIDGNGKKWIGTPRGVAVFDGVSWTVYDTSNSGLPSNDVYAIAIDREGNKWIGTRTFRRGFFYFGGGLAKFDGVNWTVYNTSNSGLPFDNVSVIMIDKDGNKWIGTDGGGLVKFDGGNWIVYNESNSGLPDNWVLTISIDKEGNKWVGTKFRGIAVYREGGVIIKPVEIPPARFKLFQNYPNPFNSVTTIEFEVYERSFVRLVVYDVLGREVKRPFEGLVGMGRYRVNFDARGLPSGIYFYRLEVGGQVEVKKMVLVK